MRLFDLTSQVELTAFDDPDFHERMQRARDRGLYSAAQVVNNVINCMTAFAGIAAELRSFTMRSFLLERVSRLAAYARNAELAAARRQMITKVVASISLPPASTRRSAGYWRRARCRCRSRGPLCWPSGRRRRRCSS